jgi:hypothetical protein
MSIVTELWRRVGAAINVLLHGEPEQPVIIVRRSRSVRRPGVRGRR